MVSSTDLSRSTAQSSDIHACPIPRRAWDWLLCLFLPLRARSLRRTRQEEQVLLASRKFCRGFGVIHDEDISGYRVLSGGVCPSRGKGSRNPILKKTFTFMSGFPRLPKLKYSKDQLQRLTKPVSTLTPRQIGHSEELVRPSKVADDIPVTVTRYCNNCGAERKFRRDTLGYMTCMVCRELAPDRSGRAD